MQRISLEIRREPHASSIDAGYPVMGGRFFANLAVLSDSGFSPFREVFVDTGAPLSVLPARMWKNTTYRVRAGAKIGGLVRRPECRIEALLAELDVYLSDGAAIIGPLAIHAYLVDSDEIAALLGVAGVLEKLTLHIETVNNIAFLEAAHTSTAGD